MGVCHGKEDEDEPLPPAQSLSPTSDPSLEELVPANAAVAQQEEAVEKLDPASNAEELLQDNQQADSTSDILEVPRVETVEDTQQQSVEKENDEVIKQPEKSTKSNKKAAKKTRQSRAKAGAILVFETPAGEMKTVRIHSKPPGFSCGIPSMKVSKVTGSEAGEAGIQKGWLLKKWGKEEDALQCVEKGDDAASIRRKFAAVIESLPSTRPAARSTADAKTAPKRSIADRSVSDTGSISAGSEGSLSRSSSKNSGSSLGSAVPGRRGRLSCLLRDPEEVAGKEGAGNCFVYELDVVVVSARGLRDADWAPGGGSSDPYCVCEVQGKGKSSFKTKTQNNQNNPVWNHAAKIHDFGGEDELAFRVYDKDLLGSHDLLGKISLPAARIIHGSGFKGELKLLEAGTERGKQVNAFLSVKASVSRRRIEYSQVSRKEIPYKLDVTVVSAQGLRDADWAPGGGGSDPYCVCSVSGTGKTSFKTKTIDDQNNPKWRHHGIIPDFYPGDKLCFSIFDKDYGKSDDLLGKIDMDSEQLIPNGFTGDIKLKETGKEKGKEVTAFLSLLIVATKRDPEAAIAPLQSETVKAGGNFVYELSVRIVSADSLRSADWISGKSDTYCVCTVKGKGKATFKTKTLSAELNPVWDKLSSIPDFYHGDKLEFAVMDQDRFKQDDRLGVVELQTEQIIPGGFAGDLKLFDDKRTDSTAAYISVNIRVMKRSIIK